MNRLRVVVAVLAASVAAASPAQAKTKRKKRKKEPPLAWRADSEVAYEWLWDQDSERTVFDRPFFRQTVVASSQGSKSYAYTASYRLREDRNELRALNIEGTKGAVRVVAGLQEVAWGEAFGAPIVDVVQPYDLTQYLRVEPSEARIPVAMLNTTVSVDAFSLQAIATPLPRRSLPPSTLAGLPVRVRPGDQSGKDAEYGLRLGYLMPFGLDVKPFSFQHWSRTPVYRLVSANAIELVETRVVSSGLSFSQAFSAVVLRGDAVVHRNQPLQDPTLMTVRTANQTQAVLGADYTTSSGKLTIGAQVQGDHVLERDLAWGAVRVQAQLLKDRLEPEIMLTHGLGNDDTWAKYRLNWNVAATTSFSVDADYVYGTGDGDTAAYAPQRRYYSRVTVRF